MLEAIAPFAALALFATPWVLLVGRRYGHLIGAIGALTALALLVLASFHVSRLLGADPVLVTLVVAFLCGAAGMVLILRDGFERPGRDAIATWLPPLGGLVAWLSTLAIAPLVGGSIRGWAMRGDAGNNLRISREMLENHGHLLGQLSAVPLQNEYYAIAMWAGRGGSAADVFSHDLYALAVIEALAFGLTGVLLGVVASSLLPVGAIAAKAIVGGLASLASITWFVAGLPLESGYLNVQVVLPYLLATWLVHLRSRQHPAIAGVLQFGLALAILSCWAPLIVVPAGFGLAMLARYRNSARVPSGPIALAVALLVVVGSGTLIALNIAAVREIIGGLAYPGHGFPSTAPILGVGAAAIAVIAYAARRRLDGEITTGIAAVSASSVIGLAVLLAINIGAENAWLAYYPAKYTWLVTVLVLAVLTALVVRVATVLPARRATVASAAFVALALVAATLGPAPLRENFEIEQPLVHILTDSVFTEGERSVDTIIEYNGTDGIILDWDTGSPDEAFINFWALEFKGTGPNDNIGGSRYITLSGYRKLRDTGGYEAPAVGTLCGVVSALGGEATVHSRNPRLAEELEEECPDVSIEVLLDLPPRE